MPSRKAPVSNLEQHLGYWLRFVSNHVSHAFMQKVEAQGVTVAEWALMRQMLQSGPVNPSQIANTLGMTRGAISKLIDRLCQKDLAERSTTAQDRRFQSVSLTSKGRLLVPALAKLADDNDAEFFGHLTEEQQNQLFDLLKRIVQRHGWKDIPVS